MAWDLSDDWHKDGTVSYYDVSLQYLCSAVSVFSSMLFLPNDRWIGVEGSTGTFTVEVPKAGNYAVNISYIAATGLDMNVRVNSGKEKTFNFLISGRRCFEGNTHPNGNGEPTVVAMELQGFKEGINTIHLSQGTSLQVPVIEWIAVVPKEGIA